MTCAICHREIDANALPKPETVEDRLLSGRIIMVVSYEAPQVTASGVPSPWLSPRRIEMFSFAEFVCPDCFEFVKARVEDFRAAIGALKEIQPSYEEMRRLGFKYY